MHLEIWKRFLMASDEEFKTKEEKLMEAIKTVRELMRENNLCLTFYSKPEKCITKGPSEENKLLQIRKKKKRRKQLKNENSKYHKQEKMKIQKKKWRSQPKKFFFHQRRWQTP